MELTQHIAKVVRSSGATESQLDSVKKRRYPTSKIERLILAATIAAMPVEDHIPTVAGRSILFIMFAISVGYIVLNRSRAVNRVWLHPVFVAAYTFFAVTLLIESAHPLSTYREHIRLAFMILGAVVFASICRDKQALKFALYGYVVGSLWLSSLLFFTSYDTLRQASATNYAEASRVRGVISEDISIAGDLNTLAFLAAQGGIVALALSLTTHSLSQRYLLLGASLFCLIGAFLTMSRGGIIVATVGSMIVLSKFRARRTRVLAVAAVLLAAIVTLVPDVVFSRLDVSTGGRNEIYRIAVEKLPEYVWAGLGNGNYWTNVRYFGPMGTHNAYLAIMLYWGLPGLLAFLGLIFQTWRYLPQRVENDGLALCLPGIAVAILLETTVSHVLAEKSYSTGLGLFVAAQYWLWPAGAVKAPQVRNRIR